MMAIGNREFVTVMRLCGLKKSFVANQENTEEEIKEIFASASKGELVVVSSSIITLAPFLEKEHNVVSLPDKIEDFSNLEDLNNIIVSAVGSGFELEED